MSGMSKRLLWLEGHFTSRGAKPRGLNNMLRDFLWMMMKIGVCSPLLSGWGWHAPFFFLYHLAPLSSFAWRDRGGKESGKKIGVGLFGPGPHRRRPMSGRPPLACISGRLQAPMALRAIRALPSSTHLPNRVPHRHRGPTQNPPIGNVLLSPPPRDTPWALGWWRVGGAMADSRRSHRMDVSTGRAAQRGPWMR